MASPDATAQERLRRMVDAHQLLADVSRSLGPALELDRTVREVLEAMRRLVSFRGGSVCLVEGGLIRIVAAHPSPSEEVLAARLPVGEGLAGRVVADAAPVYSPDLDADDRVDPGLRRLGSNAGMTSYLGVPLICLGRVIGLLQVDSPEVDAFDEVDRTLLSGFGAQVASAIEAARQLEDQERLERQKRGFIQLVSHELRTPLTIAKGFVESLMDDREMDAETTAFVLDRTHQAVSRLEMLVEELIIMSELAGDDVRPRRKPTDLHRVLAGVAADSVDPARVTVLCPEGTIIVTDEELARRAVGAVIDNALKYAGDALVSVVGSRVEVRDHGRGIPSDIVGRELEHFTRSAENDTTTAGLGLGLAMASTLANALDGSLTLAAAPDGGTIVALDLGPEADEAP